MEARTVVAPTWIIMPVVANRDLTIAAIADCLAQTVSIRLLIVLQDVEPPFRQEIERLAEQDARVLVWSHSPPLPSLSATWNRALQFVWAIGGEEALVVNNDTRLAGGTVACLSRVRRHEDALFVTAVGVTDEQFAAADPSAYDEYYWSSAFHDGPMYSKGGPDFSCFLISKAGHESYPFDEGFIPGYLEDLDTHRRYLLGGDGQRIFSINLPYHHIGGGSQTLKAMTPEQRAAHERRIATGSRAYYRSKWGGDANTELFTIPFDATTAQPGVTTPELQRMTWVAGSAHASDDGVESSATPDSTGAY